MNKIKNITTLIFVFILFFLVSGCTKENEDVQTLDYFKEHFNVEEFSSYEFNKKITYQSVLLKEEKVNAIAFNSEYIITTIEKVLASNESTEKYEITEKEARVKDISNPLTLNLDEKYFESLDITSTKLSGKVNSDYSNELLGVGVATNVRLEVKLNSDLKVSLVSVKYIDNSSRFEVEMTVKYIY